jgi:hypothetical protein
MDRRRFCTLMSMSLVGGATGLLAACGGNESAPTTDSTRGGLLDGVSMQVHRDPG